MTSATARKKANRLNRDVIDRIKSHIVLLSRNKRISINSNDTGSYNFVQCASVLTIVKYPIQILICQFHTRFIQIG
jgi:hypothetical protein